MTASATSAATASAASSTPSSAIPSSRLYAYVNDKVTLAEKASLSVFDRGLVLGDGLFETLRAVEARPQFFSLHFARLLRSAKRLRLKIPVSESELKAICISLCRKSRLPDASVRITLTRGRYFGGLAIDPKAPPSLIVVVLPVTGLPPALYAKGVKVAVSSINKAAASGLDPRIKSTNYLANIFAKAEADAKHAYEAILLGPKGEIAECSTASFFGVKKGVVITPPIETGILPGITRQVLIKLLKRHRIPFREGDLFPREASQLSEAFLSSSVRGLLPINRIDAQRIGEGKPGLVYARLRELYAEACAISERE
jgi:branched-chain amino acid aminotransferase